MTSFSLDSSLKKIVYSLIERISCGNVLDSQVVLAHSRYKLKPLIHDLIKKGKAISTRLRLKLGACGAAHLKQII